MLRRLKELSDQHRTVRVLLSPFRRLAKTLGISRQVSDQQILADKFNVFYQHAFEPVKGGQVIVSAPDFLGDFYIDARSDLLRRFMKFGCYEPDLAALAGKQLNPGLDVIDIGANIGLFSVMFAKKVSPRRKVLAIEPTPRALELLRQNLSMNHCADNVIVFEGVATEKTGTYSINLVDGKEEYSSLGNLVHTSIAGHAAHAVEVSGETVDELVERYQIRPGFIKMDAEGAEYLVLKGSARTLKQFKPILLFELADELLKSCGASSKMVVELLEAAGYTLCDAEHPAHPIDFPFDGTILATPQYGGSG